ncbi:MAG TPA: HAD hydrolase family protein [Candidatus Coprousia avicola]|nr:HAD hydrolase family protein [Candidatus Coprousia avicola]
MIRVLCTDVDGTMTDNELHLSAQGELFKSFNARDGWALKSLLPDAGIEAAVVTGRQSDIVRKRCEELGVRRVFLGRNDKEAVLRELAASIGCEMDNVAYIGDDLNDVEALAAAGVSGCPSDAIDQAKQHATYICHLKGGQGALREFAEWAIARNDCEREHASADDVRKRAGREEAGPQAAEAFAAWAFRELEGARVVALATCGNDSTPSVRSVSALFDGRTMQFQTNSRSAKAIEVAGNPHVAVSFDKFQLKGVCRPLGHPFSQKAASFAYDFEQAFPKAFAEYSHLEDEMAFEVEFTQVASWGAPEHPDMFAECDLAAQTLVLTSKTEA